MDEYTLWAAERARVAAREPTTLSFFRDLQAGLAVPWVSHFLAAVAGLALGYTLHRWGVF